ncbi:MAG: hypothetical protein WDA16_05500 [Candidatus Thermoplasmatota archaeon]
MRGALLIGLSLLAFPLASADQSLNAGPATLSTSNTTYGDGCDGSNGGTTREAKLLVTDPRPNAGYKQAAIGTSCYRYDYGGGNVYEGSYLQIYAGSWEYNGGGPNAYYNWYGGDSAGTQYCGSSAGTGSMYEPLGCPSPDGSAPPMMPELP